MTGRKSRALQVPPVVPYTALENFSKALYGLFFRIYLVALRVTPLANRKAS